VRTARSRADLAKPKPAPKRPIYTSKTTVPRAKPSASARRNAEHYGKWFLTPELKARSRYERDKDAYELLVGGESAAIERELRVREVELGRQLEGSFGAKAYKRYVESNHSIGSGSLPGYLKSVEAAADDGSATAVTRARTVTTPRGISTVGRASVRDCRRGSRRLTRGTSGIEDGRQARVLRWFSR
jgi:hypothetical protein